MNKKLVAIVLVVVVFAILTTTLVSAKGALTLTWAIVCEDATVSPTIYQGKVMDLFQGFGTCKVIFKDGNGKPASLPGGDPGGNPGGNPAPEVTPSPDLNPFPWQPPGTPIVPCLGC